MCRKYSDSANRTAMLQCEYQPFELTFKQPAGTSRGVMRQKPGYLITVFDSRNPACKGVGEVSILPDLSPDDPGQMEKMLQWACLRVNHLAAHGCAELYRFPALRCGMEMALLDFRQGGRRVWFDSAFTRGEAGIAINGLIWMDRAEQMSRQIEEKLKQGFRCLKMKIGAISWNEELAILRGIRARYTPGQLELRVDANGAFSPCQAMEVQEVLAGLGVHSIEQPIARGQWPEMARLCNRPPVPVALDEELIGVYEGKRELLETIRPQYLILKPSLLGGFEAAHEWIHLAQLLHIGWWVTSALESNIGLQAIAQWTSTLQNEMPQGLGTGSLYKKNFASALYLEGSRLRQHAAEKCNPETSYRLEP